MLYYLLPPLENLSPLLGALNVTRYITFRTAAASLTALAISILFGPWLIRTLRDFQIGQIIRQEGPQSHRAKAGTPTMGGLLIVTAAVVPTLLWADLSNPYVWIAVMATVGFGAVGFTAVGLAAASLPIQLPWVPLLAPLAVLVLYVLVTRPFWAT